MLLLRAMTRPSTRTLALLSALCLTAPGAAQPGLAEPGARAEAMIRLRQAEIAERRGELPEALRLLELATASGAPPAAYRALARVHEALGARREAAEALRRYAALATDAPDRDEAAARAEQLRHVVGELLVEVRPNRAGITARVWIDRDGPQRYPAGGLRAMVEGGEHRVRVESPGWSTHEQRVVTGYGERLALRVELRGVSAAPTAGSHRRRRGCAAGSAHPGSSRRCRRGRS